LGEQPLYKNHNNVDLKKFNLREAKRKMVTTRDLGGVRKGGRDLIKRYEVML
jgi:hypothetical protein